MMPTLGLKAYDELRRMLMHGQLQPGMQLVNRKLADEIGMSMTPVREAVTRLASEGFVDHVPGAGAFVRRMSRQELAQLYDVRRALEPLAAAEAAENATASEIAELRAIASDSFEIIRAIAASAERHATPEQMTRWLDDEQRFHEVMFQAARNRWLSKIAADMKLIAFGFSPQRRMPEFLTVEAAVRTWRGHRRLIRALATRNPELAAATTATHIAQGKEEVFAHLASHGDLRSKPIESTDTPRGRRAKRSAPRQRTSPGFTLVELLIVVAIVAVLIGMLMPAVQSAREAARRMQCSNNQKQIGVAIQAFEALQGVFPKGSDYGNALSWRVFILPYIEQKSLYEKFDFSVGPFCGGSNREGPNKSILALNKVDAYHCPSASRFFATDGSSTLANPTRQTFNAHYYGVAGPKGTNPTTGQAYPSDPQGSYGGFSMSGVLFLESRVRAADVRDGLSNTLMAGELALRNVNSYTSSWHGGGDGGNWVRGGCCNFDVAAIQVDKLKDGPTGSGGVKNIVDGINVAPAGTGSINDCSFSSLHAGSGAVFLRGDGSVSFVSDAIPIDVYKALCSRKGGEPNVSYE